MQWKDASYQNNASELVLHEKRGIQEIRTSHGPAIEIVGFAWSSIFDPSGRKDYWNRYCDGASSWLTEHVTRRGPGFSSSIHVGRKILSSSNSQLMNYSLWCPAPFDSARNSFLQVPSLFLYFLVALLSTSPLLFALPTR